MLGILESSAVRASREWTAADRVITEWTLKKLGPLVAEYVKQYGP